ncbi:hypothetical protein P280DRAFT_481988 [Massarina eburnea CBS 473.64]|uniref:Uncharacterized protein n=1 Tax=Massarina eburnea CBS 473.64 TaxID=1395130 RepID=A0A6A6RTX8_9PLEO|nr:hypothetical protein P280DRAFT_481988 [Massarina eburnea CBS 473.64]
MSTSLSLQLLPPKMVGGFDLKKPLSVATTATSADNNANHNVHMSGVDCRKYKPGRSKDDQEDLSDDFVTLTLNDIYIQTVSGEKFTIDGELKAAKNFKQRLLARFPRSSDFATQHRASRPALASAIQTSATTTTGTPNAKTVRFKDTYTGLRGGYGEGYSDWMTNLGTILSLGRRSASQETPASITQASEVQPQPEPEDEEIPRRRTKKQRVATKKQEAKRTKKRNAKAQSLETHTEGVEHDPEQYLVVGVEHDSQKYLVEEAGHDPQQPVFLNGSQHRSMPINEAKHAPENITTAAVQSEVKMSGNQTHPQRPHDDDRTIPSTENANTAITQSDNSDGIIASKVTHRRQKPNRNTRNRNKREAKSNEDNSIIDVPEASNASKEQEPQPESLAVSDREATAIECDATIAVQIEPNTTGEEQVPQQESSASSDGEQTDTTSIATTVANEKCGAAKEEAVTQQDASENGDDMQTAIESIAITTEEGEMITAFEHIFFEATATATAENEIIPAMENITLGSNTTATRQNEASTAGEKMDDRPDPILASDAEPEPLKNATFQRKVDTASEGKDEAAIQDERSQRHDSDSAAQQASPESHSASIDNNSWDAHATNGVTVPAEQILASSSSTLEDMTPVPGGWENYFLRWSSPSPPEPSSPLSPRDLPVQLPSVFHGRSRESSLEGEGSTSWGLSSAQLQPPEPNPQRVDGWEGITAWGPPSNHPQPPGPSLPSVDERENGSPWAQSPTQHPMSQLAIWNGKEESTPCRTAQRHPPVPVSQPETSGRYVRQHLSDWRPGLTPPPGTTINCPYPPEHQSLRGHLVVDEPHPDSPGGRERREVLSRRPEQRWCSGV